MATKKTATKKTSATTRKKRGDQPIEALLAKLRAAAPPESDKDLGRWVLGKLLVEMVSKVIEDGGEIKFASNDILKIIQAIRDLDAEDDKKQVTGVRVEWVEPEKQ